MDLNAVEQLKKARPLGRVVTSFNQEDMKNENLALDILLRDQDRIIMPKKKSTITVSGEVLSPSSYVFSENLSYNDYLDLAGGIRDGAHKNNIFYLLFHSKFQKNICRSTLCGKLAKIRNFHIIYMI